MANEARTVLEVEDITAGYGERMVLRGVTLNVMESEVIAVIGHNGAGKSTLLRAIFGLLQTTGGRLQIDGIVGPMSPEVLVQSGVAYVPQGNNVFGTMTVRENLEIGGLATRLKGNVGDNVDAALAMFPKLKVRLFETASHLSGGEKQMLALARAFVARPRLLLLDEPTLGLAPSLAGEVLERVREMSQTLHVAIVAVEQKVREVLAVSSRCVVLKNGAVTYSGPSAGLSEQGKLREHYL